MITSINKEMAKREQKTIQEKIDFLEQSGYRVSR